MRTDSRERFERLWEQHHRAVWSYAARRIGPDAADDVVAETFLVAWRRLDQCLGLPWLIRVARNRIGTTYRFDRRRRHLLERLRGHRNPSASATPDIEDRDEIFDALRALSDVELEAIVLVGCEGLTPNEAADIAGCGRSAFRMRLARGRRELRTRLADLKPLTASRSE